jgi:hypothetical protein
MKIEQIVKSVKVFEDVSQAEVVEATEIAASMAAIMMTPMYNLSEKGIKNHFNTLKKIMILRFIEDLEKGLIFKKEINIKGLMRKLGEVLTSKIGVDVDIVVCAAIQEDIEAALKKADVEALKAEEAETIMKM